MKIFSSLLMSYEWQLYAWSLNFGGRGFDHWKKVGVIIDMDFLSLDFNDALRLLSHEISIVKILFSLIWILKLVLQNLNFPIFLVFSLLKFGLSIWKMTWLKVVLVGTPIFPKGSSKRQLSAEVEKVKKRIIFSWSQLEKRKWKS